MGQFSERPVNIDIGTGYELPEPHSEPDLVEVERGTPTGELLCRYWHPFALAAEVDARNALVDQ